MTMSAPTVQLYDTVEPLDAAWDNLADRMEAVPWARPGWFRLWFAAFAPGRSRVLAVSQGEKLTGVLPSTERRGVVQSASNWHTPEFHLLAEAGSAADLAGALFALRPHRISLAFVVSDDPAISAWREVANASGYRLVARPLERSPYVDTTGDWEAYVEERKSKFLRELRRRRRQLEAEGRFALEVHDGREQLTELLEEGFRVEAAGWKAARGTAILSQPATRRFYGDLACWAAKHGWLRLAFLRLDSRPIAFDFSFEHAGVHYLLKTGFDPAYGRFAPGMLIRQEMITRAFAEGLRRYEFLGADEPWKLEWTDAVLERSLLQAFAPTLRGEVERTAFAYGRPLARRTLSLVRRR